MKKTIVFLIEFCAIILVSASSFAELSRSRHTGTYNLDYSSPDAEAMYQSDYLTSGNPNISGSQLSLIGSIHGALAYTSSWGNGATSFHWEFPLVPVNDEMRKDIENTKDDFVDLFKAFVDSNDFQAPPWMGGRYYNWLISGDWITAAEREVKKTKSSKTPRPMPTRL